MKVISYSLVLSGLLALFGCATMPPPEPEEIRTETLGENFPPPGWAAKTAGISADEIRDGWLSSFDDPKLEALVAEALQNNPDLQIAATRVERAAAYIGVAKSALYPQVALKGRGSTKLGDDLGSGLSGGILEAGWELDIWGRVRYERDAAVESWQAIRWDYDWARQSLAAATAVSWFVATESLLEQQAAEKMIADSRSLLDLAETRLRIGAGDERDVTAARASLASYEENLLRLKLAHQNALRALELLLGRYPGAGITPHEELPAIPGPVPAGIPLNVLERRPDLHAAERRVAAAFDMVGEAEAAKLPALRLTASGGYASSNVLELAQDFSNPFGSIGASLFAPLFMGGKLDAQVEIRNAEQRAAMAAYAKTALNALYEVENALAAEANLRKREQTLLDALRYNRRAVELEKTAYRVGASDMRRVLDQQLALQRSRMELIKVRGEILTRRVNLYLALGGDFEVPEDTGTTGEGETTTN